MRVLLSSGIGPLHFIESVQAMTRHGIDITLILGAVLKNKVALWARIASKVGGRRFVKVLSRRAEGLQGCKYYSQPFAEFLHQWLLIVARFVSIPENIRGGLPWTVFGHNTKKLIYGYDVFHCRAGAGQGGAIQTAKKHGIKVLVDQSALHPRTCEENLKDDYGRWGRPIVIAPGRGVWINVERDCKMADTLVVNADHIKKSFVDNGYPPDKIRVVYLGVRSDFFGVKSEYNCKGHFKVLFTGAASILKGVEYLLESLKILIERGVHVEYTIIGSVLIPTELKDQYAGLPVTYLGRIPQEELKVYFKESDVYVFPSLADGCAKAGMEAMAAGMPVVATRQSGLPITDGVDGLIVPMKDAVAIADKIEWLASHEEDRARLGRCAARLIQTKFTWENYAENMGNIYEEMIRG